jgi:hypothetical protein
LRAELTLLPDILIQPPSFGDMHMPGHGPFSRLPTNVSQFPAGVSVDAGQNSVENVNENGENPGTKTCYFMRPRDSSSADPQDDVAGISAGTCSISQPGSMRTMPQRMSPALSPASSSGGSNVFLNAKR